eukprot:TRINITY_DN652_c0_g4_i1.p1 TRINITY_DN652_c0_g4~~TRINITY_DN652_c0_g4_i1.p1  ORF type:complete len:351 (-),score=94.47 TRINITY_DN652_c0_g4_i1:84-1136(-)
MKIIKSSTAECETEKAKFIFERVRESSIKPRENTMTIEADNLAVEDDVISIIMPGCKPSPSSEFLNKPVEENKEGLNTSGENLANLKKTESMAKLVEETKEVRISIDSNANQGRKLSSAGESKRRSQIARKASKKLPKRIVDPEIKKLLNIIKEPTSGQGWSLAVNEKNVTFYKKMSNNSPLVLVKGMAVIEGVPLEVMWKSISDMSLRAKWEPIFSSFEHIASNPDGTDIIYCVMKTPFPVTNRDFVQKQTLLLDYPAKGQAVIHFMSVEHASKPAKGSPVRAQTVISGYLIKEMSKFPLRCSIHIVTQVDMKGSIPKTLINAFAAGGSRGWVEKYKKGCAEIMNSMKK